MRRLAYGLVLAAALVCGGAGAVPQAEAPYVWHDPAVTRQGCTAFTAAEIPFARFAGNPGAFIGRCLHLTGIVVRRTLFDGIDGYYRRGPYEGGTMREHAERSHLGLFTGDPLYDKLFEGGAFDASVIGVAHACWQLYGPDAIVGGYCHSEEGAILVVARVRVTPTHLTRLTGEAARERVGDLRLAPPDWPERAMATALAHRWLADIETGNIADFRAISGRPPSDDMVRLAFTATPCRSRAFAASRSGRNPQCSCPAIPIAPAMRITARSA